MVQQLCLHVSVYMFTLMEAGGLIPLHKIYKKSIMSFRLTQSLSPNPYSHTTLIQTKDQNYCGHTYGFYYS